MKHPEPRLIYPHFYNNPTIRALSTVPRWTVSDCEDVPVNFKVLVTSGRIWGAHEANEDCLVTLHELSRDLPPAANCAYYLQGHRDGYALLTINATCPPDIARSLLRIPSLYSEHRGEGPAYQVIFPLPMSFNSFPSAMNRKVLVEDHGWYEITVEGWVKFSRNVVREDVAPITKDHRRPIQAWEELYAALAQRSRTTRSASWNVRLEEPEVPRLDQILVLITREPLQRSLEDFHGDYSLFEYWVLAELYTRLQPVLRAVRALEPDTIYNDSVQAWLVFAGALLMLSHRSQDPGHRQSDGAPLLRSAAVSLVTQWPLFEDTSA